MSAFGVDYSSGRPSHAALKTAGVKFVCRYIGSQVRASGRNAKWLSPSEATSLHSDGFDIVAIFETSAKRPESGSAAGTEDAHTALAELAYCGLPADLPVFYAVDYDTTVGPHITAYFEAINKVRGVPLTGAYGGYRVIKALFDKKLITWAMQTYAWSGGQWDSRAQIQQYSNGRTIGGASVDYDRAMVANFGQWPAKPLAPPPAPKPKPWPGEYYRLKSPMMHGSDVKWIQERLTRHGHKTTADGYFGTKTRDAVRSFQKSAHLEVDGIVGRATWSALAK